MWDYRYCDITIRSDIALPELPLSSESRPEISFRCIQSIESVPDRENWIEQDLDYDEDPFLVIAKRDTEYLLRHFDLADFVINGEGTDIECRLYAPLPEETIRHLLLDQVLPRLLSHQGRLMLHSGAVLTPGGIIAFLGDTGWGKSTLAASLVQLGVTLVTDDCLYVSQKNGKLFGVPAYTGMRLLPDSLKNLYPKAPELLEFAHYSDKKRLVIEASDFSPGDLPLPLLAIFLLSALEETADMDEVRIEPLSPVETLMALTRHSFKLDFFDRPGITNSFKHLGELSRLLPAFSLKYPRIHSYLPVVCEALLCKADQIAAI